MAVRAQDSIPENLPSDVGTIVEEISQSDAIVDEDSISITLPDYFPWQQVKIEGKLKMTGLPLSPSLKIFMIKDSLIDISVRAPFVGEAGRAVIDTDSVTIVNKMNKTYVKEGIAELLKYYPGGISDIQDLLLARVFIPGHDLMEENVEELVDIFYENFQFNVIPKEEAEVPGFIYGFVTDDMFNPLWLVVIPESRPDIEIDIQYLYNLKGYDINIAVVQNGNQKSMTLELKEPQWESDTPDALKINNKFHRLSFSDFMKSF